MAKNTQPAAWLKQALTTMKPGISQGKTRRRKVETVQNFGISERTLKLAAKKEGMKVAQIGNDYVFTPIDYTIRPL